MHQPSIRPHKMFEMFVQLRLILLTSIIRLNNETKIDTKLSETEIKTRNINMCFCFAMKLFFSFK